MSKPDNITDFGTVLPAATPSHISAYHARFADVKTYAAYAMPEVKPGQVYEDLDPRSKGRHLQILKVCRDNKVMVRTIAPRLCPPRTPSQTTRDTTGDISFIALRRFRENSRGFRLLRNSTIRSVNAFIIAARLADLCDIPITEMETRAADALIGLLGNTVAHEYIDALADPATDTNGNSIARDIYIDGGAGFMLQDALAFADEEDALTETWKASEVAARSAARMVARHA